MDFALNWPRSGRTKLLFCFFSFFSTTPTMFSNQLRVMGFVFFPTCLPRPGWSLDLLTLIKRISLHHERQRSPRDLKTSERRRRTDGPSRHQPNKSLFFSCHSHVVAQLNCELGATREAGWYRREAIFKKNLVLFFSNPEIYFTAWDVLVIVYSRRSTSLVSISPSPPQQKCTALKCSSSVVVCVFDIVII